MHMKKTMIYSVIVLLFAVNSAFANSRIKYYFNKPVNNSVSKGVNAIYLNNCMGDTLIAYINRAKYTLDIAVYNYTSTMPGIASAINSATTRGVKVRWIYDSSSSNTGIPLLNSNVKRMASPENAGDYTIMHNKFMIVDANSTDANDAIVWTGSANWNAQQLNSDFNNTIVIQDRALAQAYRAHFNMMWGDTGINPNKSLAKFGQYKTDLGAHTFIIDGKTVELYFSPADGVNDKILSTIASATTDLYWGMSTFTLNSNATALVNKKNEGVYVAGINDGSSSIYSPFTILTSGIGANFKVYSSTNMYHNKFLIVDASNSCSDPMVLTGSHNWSFSADTKNDENTLIIHDDTAANIYYQSFHQNFSSMGGSLTNITDCVTGVVDNTNNTLIDVYPNPTTGAITVSSSLPFSLDTRLEIYNLSGQLLKQISGSEINGLKQKDISLYEHGVYFIRITDMQKSQTIMVLSK